TGIARFALISDIAARSGSSSPARAFSSSRDSFRYSSAILDLLVTLGDRGRLLRVRVRDRVVAQHIERSCEVDGRRDVRVDQRHRGALGKLLARDRIQLFAGQLPILL